MCSDWLYSLTNLTCRSAANWKTNDLDSRDWALENYRVPDVVELYLNAAMAVLNNNFVGTAVAVTWVA